MKLRKKYMQLHDVMKQLEFEIKTNQKTDFDFFRPQRSRHRDLSQLKKEKIRRKIRYALQRFINNYRKGLVEQPKALIAIA